MSLKSRQVMERVDAVEGASVNETHEQITDVGSVFGLKEEGVFAMQDRPLENLLAEVVVQGGSRNSQKQGQRLPVFEHVGDGFSHGGIGLYPPLIQLFL